MTNDDAIEAAEQIINDALNRALRPLPGGRYELSPGTMERALTAYLSHADISVVKWRRPGGFLLGRTHEPHRRILVRFDGGDVITHWTNKGVLPKDAVAWAEMPTPPKWTTEPKPFRVGPPSVDLSRCGIQDGCDSRDHCIASGESRYTGSPLIPTPPPANATYAPAKDALLEALARAMPGLWERELIAKTFREERG